MDQVVGQGELEKSATPLNPEIQDPGRNAVFAALVKGDSDVTGLVAYSIFGQNEARLAVRFPQGAGS